MSANPKSIRYHPTDVLWRDPADPGLAEPPAGRPYRKVVERADGYVVFTEYTADGERVGAAKGKTPRRAEAQAIAQTFAAAQADAFLYRPAEKAWRAWDGAAWRPDVRGRVREKIREAVDAALAAAGDGGSATGAGRDGWQGGVQEEHGTGGRAAGGRAGADRGRGRLAAAVESFLRETMTETAPFDAAPMRLGTPGGTVDLGTGVLQPADPRERITRTTAVAPAVAPGACSCPLWRRFLDEAMSGDRARVGFLQRFLGYALTGETSEHALLFGHGEGGNGKSVLANTVRGIFGDYAAVAAPDFLARGRRDARAPSAELAMLEGARLVTASETEAGAPLAEARLKMLTGGDAITARHVGGAFFTFQPRFKLVVMGNHLPVLADADAAMRRRLCLMAFTTRPARPDPALERKLRDEWPAILAWMIDGCLAWQAEGLGRPAAVAAASEDFFASQDVVGHFLHERCELGETRVEKAGALYAAWVLYAKAAGEVPGSQRLLAMALERRGMVRARSRHARLYRGLRLLTQAERDAG